MSKVILFGIIFLLTTGLVSSISFGGAPQQGGQLTIPVGLQPAYVGIDETSNTLYVVNQGSNDITVIEGNTNEIVTTIPVGLQPNHALFIEPVNRWYVLNQASSSISIIDPSTHTVVETILNVNIPFGAAFNPNTNLLYVGNPFVNTISVIDVTTNQVVNTIPGGGAPSAMEINTVTNLLYVSNFQASTISVIDTLTDTLLATILIDGGVALMGINEITNTVYVPTFFSNQVFVIDGLTNNIIDSITVGDRPLRVIFNTDRDEIYVSNFLSNTLSIIDPSTNSIVGTIPVDTPFAMNLNRDTNILYVGNQFSNTITIIDLNANSPPLAMAGPNQVKVEGETVALDGSDSSDPNGDPLEFNWTQVSGSPVALSDPSSPTPSFIAPQVDGSELFSFQLTVSDGTFDSAPDTVDILVTDVTNFQINLAQIDDGTLVGNLDVGDVNSDVPIILDFIIPQGILDLAQLDKTILTPSQDATGVSFSFEFSPTVPPSLPNLPVDSGLFFDINFQGIDFSDPASFSENKLPTTQFSIPIDVDAAERFADGCPVASIFLFNENTAQWEQLGDPHESNSNQIFAVNALTNTVSIINIGNNEQTTTIPVGLVPSDVEFNPNTNQLYVANFASGTVSIIDITTNSVIQTVPTSNTPFAMAVDTNSNLIYVLNLSGDINVIDGITNAIVDTITLPGLGLVQITLDSDNQKAYVSDFLGDIISIVDLKTNTFETIQAGDGPGQIVLNPSTNTAYVAMFLEGTLKVLDTNTNDFIKTIPIGGAPRGTIFDTNNNKVYVANSIFNTVSVIDATTNTLIKTIPVQDTPVTVSLLQSTNRIYVANEDAGTISVIDGNTDTVIGTINFGAGLKNIATNPKVSNPVRDPSTDIINNDEIVECSYLAGLPHLSKFSIGGIKALALGSLATGGGSSGGANSPPSFGQSSFAILSGGEEGFGGILNDNDANTLEETKTFKVGEKAVLRFDFTEGGGIGKIEHIGLYTNVRDGQKRQDSDAYIYYDPLKSPQVTVHDPNGLFSEANVDLLQKDATNFVIKVEITFAQPMAKSNLILESWNTQKWSSINKIPNAIEVISSGLVQQSASEPIVDTFVEDVINDQVVPVWIKSNAKWWSDGTIDNENFISGIEYLVNEGIIKVSSDSNDNTSVLEIQPWIKNTAGWWADDMISDDEFLAAIEWLISNGIIQVV